MIKINKASARIFIFVGIIASLTYSTYERNKVWQDDLTLWKDVTEKAPDNARAHNNLGRAYGAVGRDREAIEEFKKTISLVPNFALTYMNMAISYARLSMNTEAEINYRKAMQLYPTLADIYYNYGFFLYSKQRYDEAFVILNRYIELNPTAPFVPFTYKLLRDIEKKRSYGK